MNKNHKYNYFMFSNHNTVKFAWSTIYTAEEKLKIINKKFPNGEKFNIDLTIPKKTEKDLRWCTQVVKSTLKNGLIKLKYNEYDFSKDESSSDVFKKMVKIITGPRVNSQDPCVKQQEVTPILQELPKPVNIHRYEYSYISETGFNIKFINCYISETGFYAWASFQ